MTLLLISKLYNDIGIFVECIIKIALVLLVPIVVCYMLYEIIVDKDDNKNEKVDEKVKVEEIVVKDAQFEYLKHIEENSSYAKIIKHIAFDKIEKLYIPDKIDDIPITTIGKEAFSYDKLINKVILPDSIIIIEEEAFYNSTLNEIIFGNKFRKIGAYAFCNCTELESKIDISKLCNLTIGKYAFKNTMLGNVVITPNMKCEDFSFSNSKINKMEIKEGVTNLYRCEFECNDMEKVKIPNTITKIPKNCFRDCSLLEKVLIPSSVISIEEGAFEKTLEYHPRCLDGTPDMRYNSRIYTVNIKVTIYCEAGSYAQEYARKNGFNCRPILEF